MGRDKFISGPGGIVAAKSISQNSPRIPFLRHSKEIRGDLGKILGKPVSRISCVLPPGVRKRVPDTEGQFLGAGFSGAYVSIADFPESRELAKRIVRHHVALR